MSKLFESTSGARWIPKTLRGRIALALCVFSLLATLSMTEDLPADPLTVRVAEGLRAELSENQDITVEALPLRSEGLLSFSRRLTGDSRSSGQITRRDGRAARRLLAGFYYRVPFEALTDEYKVQVLRALFPQDEPRPDGWYHRVDDNVYERSMWHVAQWFTGSGLNFGAIREHNALEDNSVTPGSGILIPRELLLPLLRLALPSVPNAGITATNNGHQLEYITSDGEQYAVYRLKEGEALYSAVVVRFTGRTFANDVIAFAEELADLNRIPDVTDMGVGQAVRIPLDQLLPEYLQADDPRRIAWEKGRSEAEQYSNTVQASRLAGVTVVLDPGHGGTDPGATKEGVWESSYVYDITLRVRKLLEQTTAASVFQTVRDGASYTLIERDVLPRSKSHQVLTHPAYPIKDPRVGVHLRWYLANSLYAKATRNNSSEKVVFLSIHADSLHSSLRGAMAYIPAASLTKGSFERSSGIYASRKEVKERPRVSFSWKQRVKSEGLSRQLAEKVMKSFHRHNLAVHHEKPIRDRIVRNRRNIFVPAVLRYNAIPAKILLEVGNLNNPQDRRLFKTQKFRQQVAQAIVDAILEYYGQAPESNTRQAR